MYFGPQLQGGRPSSKRERARESLLNWRRQHLQIYAKSQRRKQKPGQVANEPFLLLFLAGALFATTLYMKSAVYCFPNFLSLPNSHELYQGARNDCATAPPQPPPNPTVQLKKKNKERLLPSFLYVQLCRRSPMQMVTKNFQSGAYLLLLLFYTSDLVPWLDGLADYTVARIMKLWGIWKTNKTTRFPPST
jgi:hypothetical protein